jgi:hypothetical protein
MSALYRVQQFLSSLWPRVSGKERALVAECLPPAAAALFGQMARRDQRHSLDVFQRVRQTAPDQADLAAAALLHDAAKTALPGRRLRLCHRVLIVLLQAARPGWVQQIARDDPGSWRYPFYLHTHHPELGGELAQQSWMHAADRSADPPASAKDWPIRPVDEIEHLLVAAAKAADDAS